METYDVIIVGAGPAGLATALYLQQMAPELASRTLILEKERHPRSKICAGGVLADGLHLLSGLGLNIWEVPRVTIKCVHFGLEERGLTDVEKEYFFNFHTVLREDLDAWLANKARERGMTLLEATPVRHILLSRSGVEVVTLSKTYQAKVVVGADGAQSVVRRAIAGRRKPRYARAVQIWAPPPPGPPLHREDGVYFDFQCIRWGIPGYVWDFPAPVRGQRMRCWGVYDSHLIPAGEKRRLSEVLAERLAFYGYSEEFPMYGGVIHHFYPDNIFAAPRVLLVGDAAGVDALFGEGISPALGYGKLAARAIVEAFAREDFSFQDYGDQVVKSSLGRMLVRRLWIARVLYQIRALALQRWIWWRLAGVVRWSIQRIVNWADQL